MGSQMKIDRKTLVRYLAAPLVAVLTFWLGGYAYFVNSADWQEIQRVISSTPRVVSKVGDVQDISVSLMPFMYKFSGESGSATLRVRVTGSRGEHRETMELQKKKGVWTMS